MYVHEKFILPLYERFLDILKHSVAKGAW